MGRKAELEKSVLQQANSIDDLPHGVSGKKVQRGKARTNMNQRGQKKPYEDL